jgi:hypothetical protein
MINNATVIRGFAAISDHPLAVKMSITISRREQLIVRRGNETLDLDTTNDDTLIANNSLLLYFPEMTLEQNRTSGMLTLSWFVGVSIQITPISTNLSMANSPLVLNIGVSIADSHQNCTFGLFGLYDNDPTNDFRAQNGSIIIPDNPFALEEIHHLFGETWAIDPDYSLFYYETGDSPLFYFNQNLIYQPSFSLPDLSTTQINSTYEICNIDTSSTDQSTWTFSQSTCYYDIAVTHDLSFGQASKLAADTAVEIAIDQRSSPEFNSALPFALTINEATNLVLNFTATSPYSLTIWYTLLQGPPDSIFDNQTALLYWQTSSSIESDTIVRVMAQDSKYSLSTIHELVVQIIKTTSPNSSIQLSHDHIISILWIFVLFNIVKKTIYFF